MSLDESAEYSLWVKLSNDPSQPEELRQHYRARLETWVHQKLREAFQLAAQSTPADPGTT